MTPRERYQHDLEQGLISPDAAQADAVEALHALYEALLAAPPRPEPKPQARGVKRLLKRLKRDKPEPVEPVTGLYLWGGVGRGKTYLVDSFFEALPFQDKQRMHFHRFMHAVHDDLKALRDEQDPLERVADRFASRARVICFDEFFVSDIADAMILGGLLQALFERGVSLVATSNIPPDDLYKDGLQRARFLPAIDLIKRYTRELNVDGGVDYRLRFLERAEIYHWPLDEQADDVLTDDFEHVIPEPGTAGESLEVEGRLIPTRRMADGVVWFDFRAVCDGPRSQADYIELARTFHTVIISGVPVFNQYRDDQARRFISLVDEFYDRGVNLIISAEAPPERLYQGERLTFAFERTVSRLQEMQSHDYLAAPHKP